MLICCSSWLLSFFVTLCFWKASALLLVYYLCCFCFIKPQLFIICSNICTSAHWSEITALLISWNQEVCLLKDFSIFLLLSLDSRDLLMLIFCSSWLLSFFLSLLLYAFEMPLLLVYYLCCFCFIKRRLFIICSNICTSAHWSEITALLISWNQEVCLLKDFSFFLFLSLDSRDPLMYNLLFILIAFFLSLLLYDFEKPLLCCLFIICAVFALLMLVELQQRNPFSVHFWFSSWRFEKFPFDLICSLQFLDCLILDKKKS